jgi:hypothetical protein
LPRYDFSLHSILKFAVENPEQIPHIGVHPVLPLSGDKGAGDLGQACPRDQAQSGIGHGSDAQDDQVIEYSIQVA